MTFTSNLANKRMASRDKDEKVFLLSVDFSHPMEESGEQCTVVFP